MAVKIKSETEKIEKGQVYEETYTMRIVGGGISTSIPKIVVEKKARELGIPVKRFIEEYEVVAIFNDFKSFDLAYKFKKREDSK